MSNEYHQRAYHILISFLLLGVAFIQSDAFAQGKGAAVRIADAEKSTFYDHVESLGTLRANEFVTLSVNVTETITAIHFEDGQAVTQGQRLVEMTSEEERALLEEAETNTAEARRQLVRIRELVKSGTASESTLDVRQRDYDAAKARLVATQSRLRDRVIVAPFDGVVGLRNVSVGALVRPGDVITTLTDNSKMKLDFSVPSRYLADIKIGSPIKALTNAFKETEFLGTVSSIDNVIDPITRAFKVRAIIPNENRKLKPGLLMHVELLLNERESVVIPEEAVSPSGENAYVFVVKASEGDASNAATQVDKRLVTLARRRVGEVEVLSGIHPGERVVIHGADGLSAGDQVNVQTGFKTSSTESVK